MPDAKKVLIIEDDKSLREILSAKLSEAGLNTVPASDGEEGLNLALKDEPSLILLDLQLPRLSGRRLLQRLRSDKRGKSIPVIVLTNEGNPMVIQEAAELAAPAYFVKAETSLSEILEAVNYHLRLA